MKNNTVIFLSLLLLIFSCTNKTSQKKDKSEKEFNTNDWVQFPFVTIDSIWIDNNIFHINLVDSTPFLNTTYLQQYTSIHILQSEPHLYDCNAIKIKVVLPNRDGEPIEYEITPEDYNFLLEYFSDVDFKSFIREYILLNYEAQDNYYGEMTTLIDRVNMIFAHEIDKNYPDLFQNNSTWFGYDSFDVFRLYFVECTQGKEDVGHDLINSINDKTDYLKEGDILKLQKLIEKYKKIFDNR